MRKFTLLLALCLSLVAMSACSSDDEKPSNNAPVLSDDAAATITDTGFTIDVLRNDMDPDGDTLSLLDPKVDAASGTVSLSLDGLSIIYTPAAGFSGTAMIEYTVVDSRGAAVFGSVSVTVVASATLNVVSGDAQSDIAGRALDPMVVEVQDNMGNPLPGAYVNFAVTTGGGSLSTTTVSQIADAMGRVSSILTLGPTGAQSVTATMAGAGPLVMTATAVDDIQIDTASLPAGTTGTTYLGAGLSASGGFGPYSYAITSGTAPAGLTFNTNGTFTGTPSAGSDSNYDFTFEVTGANSNTATKMLSLTINDGIAPSAPTDLSAVYSGVVDTVDLTLMASGDDAAVGTATSYVVRTSTNDITNQVDFDAATDIPNAFVPAATGVMQTLRVPAEWYDGDHYFAIVAVDENGNMSAPSASFLVNTDQDVDAPGMAFDFGMVAINSSMNHDFVFSNNAVYVDFVISSTTVGGGNGFTIVSGSGMTTVTPGQSHSIRVSFTPTSAMAFMDTLAIAHNEPNAPSPANLALSGTGVNATPTVTSAMASPAQVNQSGNTVLTVIASDLNSSLPGTNDIAQVLVDVSAFGGSSATQMAFQGMSGNAQSGSYTFQLAIPAMQVEQTYMIPFVVTDNAAASVNGMIALEVSAVPNVGPTMTLSIFNPASVTVGSMTTLTVRVNDANSNLPAVNDVTSVVANLTSMGGAAAQALTKTQDISTTQGEYTFAVDTTGLAQQNYSIAITATDSLNQTAMGTAMVAVNPPANTAPVINSATFAPASVPVGNMSTLTVNVTDVDSSLPNVNDLASVTVNLTAAGGSATQALTLASNPSAQTAIYTHTFDTTGVALNSYSFAVTATDMGSATDSENASLTVTAANAAPTVSSSTQSPAAGVLQSGAPVTLRAVISDANSATPGNNSIDSVTIDLSQLGLSAQTAMAFTATGSTGFLSVYEVEIATFGVVTGVYSLPFTATDDGALSVNGNLSLTINDVAGDRTEILYEFPQAASNGSMDFGSVGSKIVLVCSNAMDVNSFKNTNGRTLFLHYNHTVNSASMSSFPTPSYSVANGIAGMSNRIVVIDPNLNLGSLQEAKLYLYVNRKFAPAIGTGISDMNGNPITYGHADAVNSGIVADDNGTNRLESSATLFEWSNSTVVDSSAPSISAQAPATSSSTNFVRQEIRISLNETINPETLAANFTVTDLSGAVSGTVHIDPTTLREVWFKPTRDYNGTVTCNLDGVEDLTGNAMTASSFTFTATTDTTDPVLSNVTVNDIPDHINGSFVNGGGSIAGGKIRTARTGFTIDLGFSDTGSGVSPDFSDISIKANVAVAGTSTTLANAELIGRFSASDVVITPSMATLLVPSSMVFPDAQSVTITVTVDDVSGNTSSAVTYTFETFEASAAKTPFESQDLWHFAFDRDHETLSVPGAGNILSPATPFSTPDTINPDALSDFRNGLEAMGFRHASGNGMVDSNLVSMNNAVENWIKNRIIYYTYRYYGLNTTLSDGRNNPFFFNVISSTAALTPSNASDGPNIRFKVTDSPVANSRLGFGGVTTNGTLGRASFDFPNSNLTHDNGISNAETDLGVFTNSAVVSKYDNDGGTSPGLYDSFYLVTSPFPDADSGINGSASNGNPVGTLAVDSTVLDPQENPSNFTTDEMARYKSLLYAFDAFALDAARVTAHEVGHSVGLIEDGTPGGGMYGGNGNFGGDSAHIDLTSFTPGAGQNVMDSAGGLLHSHSRFTSFNKLVWAYMRHRCVVN